MSRRTRRSPRGYWARCAIIDGSGKRRHGLETRQPGPAEEHPCGELAVCRRNSPSLVTPFADARMVLSRVLGCFLGHQLTHNSVWTDGWTIDDGDRVDVPVLKQQTRKLEIVIDSLPLICIAHRYLLGPSLLQAHVGRSRHWQCMTSHDIGRPAHWPARSR